MRFTFRLQRLMGSFRLVPSFCDFLGVRAPRHRDSPPRSRTLPWRVMVTVINVTFMRMAAVLSKLTQMMHCRGFLFLLVVVAAGLPHRSIFRSAESVMEPVVSSVWTRTESATTSPCLSASHRPPVPASPAEGPSRRSVGQLRWSLINFVY